MARPEGFLILCISANGEIEARNRLSAAFSVMPFASVLIRPLPGAVLAPAPTKALVELIQKHDATALIADDDDLARIIRADGVHLSWSKDVLARYAKARENLGERYVVGADAGRSRHEAMELAEVGATYIAFGIPPHVEDRATAGERQHDLIEWWSEIFEVPCVAFDVPDAAAAADLAAAGADFVTMTLEPNALPAETVDLTNAFATALASVKVTA